MIIKENGPQGPQKLSSLKTLKIQNPHRYSCNHHKWLPYKIIFHRTVKNVKIDPQITEIWLKKLNVP